jgi:phosphomannomutase
VAGDWMSSEQSATASGTSRLGRYNPYHATLMNLRRITMGKRYFGTDGIRGRVGEYPITAEFVLKLGWAVGRVLQTKGFNKVVIGKDTRISGYMFESALEAGLSAAGVNIALLGPMPTPGIAYLTRTLHACAGIVVSASHNPYYDNGIKFFSRDGQKLPDAVEERIEELLDQPLETVEPDALGKAERIVDAAGRYIEFCKSTIPRLHQSGGDENQWWIARTARPITLRPAYSANWARPSFPSASCPMD